MSDLERKNVNFPSDWITAIDRARGDQSFGDYCRQAIAQRLTRDGIKSLSDMPAWGQGRPPRKHR